VSKPVVYDHFPTRQALLAALLREYGAYVLQRIVGALAGHVGDVEGALRAATRAYFDCVAERGASLARLASMMLADPEMRAAGHKYRDKIFTLIAQHFAPVAGLPPEIVKLPVAMLVASGEEAVHQWESGAVSRALAEETQVQLILAARSMRESWIARLPELAGRGAS